MRRLLLALGGLALVALAALLLGGRSRALARRAPRATPAARAPAALAPAIAAPGRGASPASAAVALRGAWGARPGEFGRRRDPESNPEAPMALAAGAPGELAVLDQVNRRVQRYRGGRLLAILEVGGDTAADLALGPEGRTVVLDRLADRTVQVYDPSGKLLSALPLVGPGVDEGGDTTGVFADDEGVYVERQHGSSVRVADVNGNADPNRPELLGRPSRDGRLLVQAEIAHRAAGECLLRATDRPSGRLAWVQRLRAGQPIVHILMLDSDRRGNVYLAADVGSENGADFAIVDERVVVARFGLDGTPSGRLELPPWPAAEETLRPMAVDDEGGVLVMVPQEGGLQVLRYLFP